MISFFDLHCDTLSRAYLGNYNIYASPLHISLEKSSIFRSYKQVMAIWTDNSLSNYDGYKRYREILNYAKNQGIKFVTHLQDDTTDATFILSIEDLRIIESDISRISELYSDGVRLAIPFWRGTSQLGGAWDTNEGLSALGSCTIKCMLELGIIPDISHSSIFSIDEIIELCSLYKKPLVASHSNAFSVCNHSRNLSRQHFLEIVSLGGVVGISLCPEHLSSSGFATIDDILRHIDYYLSLDGENHICFGCDFDGISSLPLKIYGLEDMPKIYIRLLNTFGETIARKIFYDNAYSFLSKNLL